VAALSWAVNARSTPGALEQQLRQASVEAGIPMKDSFSSADIDAAIGSAMALLDGASAIDPDILALKNHVEVALTEIEDRPAAFQSMSVMLIGGGIVLALAVIGKLKVKDGKWELVEGLPGIEKLAQLFPSLFRP
jgi:hypothetical protein